MAIDRPTLGGRGARSFSSPVQATRCVGLSNPSGGGVQWEALPLGTRPTLAPGRGARRGASAPSPSSDAPSSPLPNPAARAAAAEARRGRPPCPSLAGVPRRAPAATEAAAAGRGVGSCGIRVRGNTGGQGRAAALAAVGGGAPGTRNRPRGEVETGDGVGVPDLRPERARGGVVGVGRGAAEAVWQGGQPAGVGVIAGRVVTSGGGGVFCGVSSAAPRGESGGEAPVAVLVVCWRRGSQPRGGGDDEGSRTEGWGPPSSPAPAAPAAQPPSATRASRANGCDTGDPLPEPQPERDRATPISVATELVAGRSTGEGPEGGGAEGGVVIGPRHDASSSI